MLPLTVLLILCAAVAESNFIPEKHKNWKFLPHDICGQVTFDRIIGGKEPPINAYPWLALIGYTEGQGSKIFFKCGGALINKNVVVSAAHCVYGIGNISKLNLVRLGEHRIGTDPDCENGFCADPVLNVKILEAIIPKNFNTSLYKHDLAIIRLVNDVKYTRFIRPICLPVMEINQNLVGKTAETAGWGYVDVEKEKFSKVLQAITLPIREVELCEAHKSKRMKFDEFEICAGGEKGRDSCNGDSGGPLMKVGDTKNGPRYFIIGLVSIGPKKCARLGFPGIYTRISAHMKWLLDNIFFTCLNSKIVYSRGNL